LKVGEDERCVVCTAWENVDALGKKEKGEERDI
jgi:hypothetical protein